MILASAHLETFVNWMGMCSLLQRSMLVGLGLAGRARHTSYVV